MTPLLSTQSIIYTRIHRFQMIFQMIDYNKDSRRRKRSLRVFKLLKIHFVSFRFDRRGIKLPIGLTTSILIDSIRFIKRQEWNTLKLFHFYPLHIFFIESKLFSIHQTMDTVSLIVNRLIHYNLLPLIAYIRNILLLTFWIPILQLENFFSKIWRNWWIQFLHL